MRVPDHEGILTTPNTSLVGQIEQIEQQTAQNIDFGITTDVSNTTTTATAPIAPTTAVATTLNVTTPVTTTITTDAPPPPRNKTRSIMVPQYQDQENVETRRVKKLKKLKTLFKKADVLSIETGLQIKTK